MSRILSLTALATFAAVGFSLPAQAQTLGVPVIASYHGRGMCLDVRANDKAVLLYGCHGGGNQAFRFARGNYGWITVGYDDCLTGGRNRGSGLSMQFCDANNRHQKWAFQPDGSLRNEAGWCADIENESRNYEARIISWECKRGSTNQMWYPAVTRKSVNVSLATLGGLKPNTQGIIGSSGFSPNNLVAAGGGNLVAAGGGNLVAAGGGNLVAAGGGNIVVGGAGSLVAAGGGNLVAAGGGNVVPTNAGNLVAAGGGNLLPSSWNFFNNTGAGNLVGNDGASFRPR